MGKSTHFSGQPVYHQVIKLLDKQQIKQISLETPRSEAYVKRLDGWTHLVIMLFGVLKHLSLIRFLTLTSLDNSVIFYIFAFIIVLLY
ncbi:DUF4372 domain-containing protein [Prevotella nigrescens]|uniref:DUF4372 domain-containing protein n=1 Tax=Prevotella nigrescens TaxID=28133 RepID=UPI00241F6E80|nr:DUF4372 domain-containing protein [Prevotella nigrescens]